VPLWQRPKTYKEGWSERQTPETWREENLTPWALKGEDPSVVTIEPWRLRFLPAPPRNSRCRDPMQCVLRVLLALILDSCVFFLHPGSSLGTILAYLAKTLTRVQILRYIMGNDHGLTAAANASRLVSET
jgi:hypothetical protein